MRILHTSDWHLGRQFHNVSLLEDQRIVLEQIIDIVREKSVDVLLIAGDVYDRSVPPADAVEVLDHFLQKVNQDLGIPIILIAGNHDGAERLGFAASQLAKTGLHIVGPLRREITPVVLSDEYGDVRFFNMPYAEPATVRDVFDVDVKSHDQATAYLTAEIQSQHKPDSRTVVMAHCFIDGGEVSDSERPLSIGGADRVSAKHFENFNYVALGHLHGPQFKLQKTIRYSGSILKYSFSETRQNKSVTLVDMDADGHCQLSKIPLKAKRDMRVVEGNLADILQWGAEDKNSEDYLLVRLDDTHAILNVMDKLRQVYPNVLHVERPGLMKSGERSTLESKDKLKGELPLFKDFYLQMTGDELSGQGEKLVSDLLTRIHHGKVAE